MRIMWIDVAAASIITAAAAAAAAIVASRCRAQTTIHALTVSGQAP